MKLLIVRHATAAPRGAPDVRDEDRPLTAEGQEKFGKAAAGLARLLDRPDVLLTSPLLRARQTAEIAARAWGRLVPEPLPALATGDLEGLGAALERHRRADLVALFGHEPHVSALLSHLLGTAQAERLAFKKGAAALVEVPGRLSEGGTLLGFLPPKVLRGLSG
jgi:phosphohistidine phosphatase